MVMICPRAGAGNGPFSPRQASSIPLRLMFSVYMALRAHNAGEVTWHQSWISIRGLSRRLIFLIGPADTGEFSVPTQSHQYRKWAIPPCIRRLSGFENWPPPSLESAVVVQRQE